MQDPRISMACPKQHLLNSKAFKYFCIESSGYIHSGMQKFIYEFLRLKIELQIKKGACGGPWLCPWTPRGSESSHLALVVGKLKMV